ncbi:repeat and SAM domain-containing 1A [Octopus vulgaris]|uniref:Repeat and SAM domain-containing 1A n=1 Tax=Octopus vulgaris TaxID=6645 RepID=A0AA36FI17_OCTVU|nr:repeat and SAM domain-containing 1A [Octopus vulgaris]
MCPPAVVGPEKYYVVLFHKRGTLENEIANQYHLDKSFLLYEWLRQHNLEYYHENFMQSGRDSLDILEEMELPDEEIYDDLEITLPGHKKRLERAVSQLKKKKQIDKEVEYPVAYGRWMKPKCLVYAKFDFLCIDATVFSTKHPDRAEELEFMVDSGSDVVTLRKDIVEKLDLKLLGHVRSKGVHVSMHKTLYEAKLKLGSVELKIEVISEEYNSLGNRVFRCFRHYISGSRHIWLKGDYVDPSMQCEPSGNYSQKDRESDEENNQISVMKPTDSKPNGCPLDEVVSNTEEAKSKADQTEDDEAQRLDHIASQDIDNQTKQNYTEGDELAEYSESVQEKYKTPKRSRKLRPLCGSKLKRDRKSRKRKRNLFTNEEPSRKKACGKLTYDTVVS